MEEALLSGEIQWLRCGRLRLRGLTRADLALLSGDGVSAQLRGAQTYEAWPQAALVEALMRRHPDLQIAVEVDQCVVGGLLACPRAEGPTEVMHPWSRRDESEHWGDARSETNGKLPDESKGILPFVSLRASPQCSDSSRLDQGCITSVGPSARGQASKPPTTH